MRRPHPAPERRTSSRDRASQHLRYWPALATRQTAETAYALPDRAANIRYRGDARVRDADHTATGPLNCSPPRIRPQRGSSRMPIAGLRRHVAIARHGLGCALAAIWLGLALAPAAADDREPTAPPIASAALQPAAAAAAAEVAAPNC